MRCDSSKILVGEFCIQKKERSVTDLIGTLVVDDEEEEEEDEEPAKEGRKE